MGKYWSPLENASSWRRISVGTWGNPDDPTIYGHDTLDVTDALTYLEAVSDASGVRVSMTALVVMAFAKTFHENPELNVTIVGKRVQQRHSVDAFCQVAIPNTETGSADLSGVKLRGVNDASIVEIAERLTRRAKRVRAGQDPDLQQTKEVVDRVPYWLMRSMLKVVNFLTFNVPINFAKLGMKDDPFGSYMVSSIAPFGIKMGYAPLVPISRVPLVALPGVVHDAPLVHDGEVKVRKGLIIGCTFDHRCFDGYQIGHINRRVREIMEHPQEHLPLPETFRTNEASANEERDQERPAAE